jgi:cellulose synthase/poly-beta-1,6-N-acetylglucosamine synthase-like glycosyltransferase
MISVILTSYKEPRTIGRAIESILSQNILEPHELIVAAPDEPTLNVARKYASKNKQIKIFKDPGKGKTNALNLLLKKVKGEIIVLSDGDVYVGENSFLPLIEAFKDKKVGCVTGRPSSLNNRKNLFGFWSHILCYAAHRLRLSRHKKNEFLECSGYLWAFRKGVIKKIPEETAEDSIVPIIFYQKGYEVAYVPESKVFIKFPSNLSDFVDQKKRTAKAHETFGRYVDMKNISRMKSLKNEIFGCYKILKYPKNLLEFLWLALLFPIRLYIWSLVFYKRYILKDVKVDNWNATKSTK